MTTLDADDEPVCVHRIDLVAAGMAPPELVLVQRVVLDAASGQPPLLMGHVTSAREWFSGLRFVAALHRMFASVELMQSVAGMPAAAVDAFAAATGRRGTQQALRVRIPPSAAHAGADLLAAVPVLTAADPAEAAERLVPLARAEADVLTAATDRRDRLWTVDRPAALDMVWRSIRRSRHHRFDPTVRRVPRSPGAAGLHIDHVPQLVALAECQELIGAVPGVSDQTRQRMLAAGCARLLGARSWRQAATWLEMPSHGGTLHQRAPLITSEVGEAEFWRAASTVLDRLVVRGRIDYRARRHALVRLWDVPIEVLEQIGTLTGMWIGPADGRHAAAWVWGRITSGDLRDAPAYTSGPTPRGADLKRRTEGRRRFLGRLSPAVERQLCAYGWDLLSDKGIR